MRYTKNMKNTLHALVIAVFFLITAAGAEATLNITGSDAYNGTTINNFNVTSEITLNTSVWGDMSAIDTDNWLGTGSIYSTSSFSDLIYFGSTSGKLVVYNKNNYSLSNLENTDESNWIGLQNVYSLDAYNTTAVYTGLQTNNNTQGIFGVYNPITNVWRDITNQIASFISGSITVYDVEAYNATAVYTGLPAGLWGVYNPVTNIWSDLSATDTGNWIGSSVIYSVSAYNSTAVYLGIGSGKFGVYNPVTNVTTDLSATDTGNWISTADIYSIFAYNSTAVYLGGSTGRFGVYNPVTNVANSLMSTDPANWASTDVNSIFAYNSTAVFTGLNGGKFGVYNPVTNVWSDLSATDAGDWVGTSNVLSIHTNTLGETYTALQTGKYGVYNSNQSLIINQNTTTGSLITSINTTAFNNNIISVSSTQNNYFSFVQSFNNYVSSSLQVNFTPFTILRAFNLSGGAISNFSVNYSGFYTGSTSTTNGVAYVPLFNGTFEVTLFDAVQSGINYARESVNLTANPYIQSYNFTLYKTGSIDFFIKNSANNSLLNVQTNITLSGVSGSYSFSTNNGTFFVDNINNGFYFVTIVANGFPITQGLLTVAEVYQVATFFVDSSYQQVTFSVLDTFNNPVFNATVTFFKSINGSYQSVSQSLTDISGTFSVNLNPTVRYLVTSVASGYRVFSGEIQPSQPQTYVIRMELPSEIRGNEVFSNFFYNTRFVYNNNTPSSVIFDYEITSTVGDISYFWANTSYIGTNYFSNVSGIPGGGVIQFNITGFDISVQNEFNVTIAFKRAGFEEIIIVIPFYLEYYDTNQYSAYTGLFNLPVGVAGRAIIGTILLLIAVAGMWSLSSSSEATMITGMVIVGLFSVPAIGLFPVVFGVITVSVLGIILIGDATVNR